MTQPSSSFQTLVAETSSLEKIAGMSIDQLDAAFDLLRGHFYFYLPSLLDSSLDFFSQYRLISQAISASCDEQLAQFQLHLDAIFSRRCELTRHDHSAISLSINTGQSKFLDRAFLHSTLNRKHPNRAEGPGVARSKENFFAPNA